MSEVYNIIFMFKCVLPGEREVISLVLPLHAILVVANINAASSPPFTLFGRCFGINQGPHPVIVQTVWFHQVYHIEAIRLASPSIGNSKVVPLSVPSCVIIRLKDQVILVLVNLNRSSQISALES